MLRQSLKVLPMFCYVGLGEAETRSAIECVLKVAIVCSDVEVVKSVSNCLRALKRLAPTVFPICVTTFVEASEPKAVEILHKYLLLEVAKEAKKPNADFWSRL